MPASGQAPMVSVEFEAKFEKLLSGWNDANRQVVALSREMGTALTKTGAGASDAAKGFSLSTESIRAWRSDVREEARYAKFFAGQLQGLGLEAKGVGGQIAEMASGFAFGGGMGLGVEVVKLLASEWRSYKAALKEVQEAYTTMAGAAADAWTRIRDATRVSTEAQKAYRGEAEKAVPAGAKIAEQIATLREGGPGLLTHIRSVLGDSKGLQEYWQRIESLNEVLSKYNAKARNTADIQSALATEAQKAASAMQGEKVIVADLAAQMEILARGALGAGRSARPREGTAAELNPQWWKEQTESNFGRINPADDPNAWTEGELMGADKDASLRAEVQFKAESEAAKQALEARKQQLEDLSRIGQHAGATLGAAFAGMATGAASASKAFVAMGKSIVQSVTDAAIKSLEAYALSSEGAAYFSQVGIPVVGPILAIAAAAAAGAFVTGLIPSAAGGWNIPSNVNPIVQAHAGEHIIPADIAQRYEAGAPGAGHTFNIYALDSQSFEDALDRNDSVLARKIVRLSRDGRL